MTARQRVWFELRYMLTSPASLFLIIQFIILTASWRVVAGADVRWWGYRPTARRPATSAFWLVTLPVVVVFLIEDAIYNASIGWLLFGERPREWLFSDRLTRYAQGKAPHVPSGRRGALRIAAILNWFDEGHIRL